MISLLGLVLLFLPTQPQGSNGSIAGQVLNSNGTPAASVRVAAMPVDAQAANLSVLSAIAQADSAGRFRIDNVEPGTYYITAGLVSQPTFYPGVATQAGARAVTLAAGASITGLDFKVVTSLIPPPSSPFLLAAIARPSAPPAPTFAVSGRVALDPGQLLAPDVRAVLGSFPSVPIRPDGSFEVAGVSPGIHQLRTNLVFTPSPVKVDVVDKNVEGVSVRVPFTGRVTGRIEAKGAPLAEPISLSIRAASDPANRLAVSFAQSFVLNLPEGEYRVMPERLASGYSIQAMTTGTTNLQTDVLKISRGDDLSLVVALNDAPQEVAASDLPAAAPTLRELQGKVQIEGAVANAIVAVRFMNASGSRATAILDLSLPGPAFKVALPIGEYKVEILLPAIGNAPNPLRVKSATYGSSDILTGTLRVTPLASEQVQVVLTTASQ